MTSHWNQRPQWLTARLPVRRKRSALGGAKACLLAVICFLTGKYGHLLGWQNSLGVAVLKALTSLIAGLLGLWGLGTLLSRSGSSEQPALTASLTNRQRALLGLPLQPQSASETAGAAPGRGPLPAQIPHASLTPPLRRAVRQPGGSLYSAPSPEPQQHQQVSGTPPSTHGWRGAVRNPSPSEFAGMLAEFDAHSVAPGQPACASPYDMHAMGLPGVGLNGGPSPTYRPSLLPRGKAAPVHRGGERQLAPSPLELRSRVLERLGLSENDLQASTEALREWMAQEVLQPLVDTMEGAHSRVEESAAQLGLQGIRLSSLESPAPLSVASKNLGRGEGIDDEALVLQLRDQIVARLRPSGTFSLTPDVAPPPEALACLQAIATYQQLSAVLKGEAPPGILPATPRGYVASRIRRLAEGPCVTAFDWSAGGLFGGKSWTLELPTDSVLLLYIFAAFLAAPHWHFLQDPATSSSQVDGGQGPLYLGKLPSRVSGPYFAILPLQPPANHQATGVIGTQLGTAAPLFSLVLNGNVVLTSGGRGALWDTLALFLRHCARECHGAVSSRSLAFLGVAEAVAPEYGARRIPKRLLPLLGW
ncbi:hypothetical protein ACKKBG_A12125 [Auxenochlorella protothecoides x Auxenochlorella symbiontica]